MYVQITVEIAGGITRWVPDRIFEATSRTVYESTPEEFPRGICGEVLLEIPFWLLMFLISHHKIPKKVLKDLTQ